MNKFITTNFLNLQEVKEIASLLQMKHNVDYNIVISSKKNSDEFLIEFKEE